MGKWPLEVFKMCCYMAFPVGCFHYFNQPENFEELIIKARKDAMRGETPEIKKELKDFIEEHKRKARLKEVEAMEASEKKFQELNAQKLA